MFSRRLFSAAVPHVVKERIAVSNAATPAHISVISLNRPDKLNPMDLDMGEAFSAVLEEERAAEGLRCVIITGKGRAFSAGGDLDFLEERSKFSQPMNERVMHAFYSRWLALRNCPVPVVSAINGPAVGAGLLVALAGDIRVTHKDNKLGIPFSSLGISCGMASTHLLPAAIGHQQAARMLLTGETISGEEAHKLGMVAHLSATSEDVLKDAINLAQKISSQSPVAVKAMVRLLRDKMDAGGSLSDTLSREARVQAGSYLQGDLPIGISAARNKKKAIF